MRKSDGLTWWNWWKSGKPAGPLLFTPKYLESLTLDPKLWSASPPGLLISTFKEDVTAAKYLQENSWHESPTTQCPVHISASHCWSLSKAKLTKIFINEDFVALQA